MGPPQVVHFQFLLLPQYWAPGVNAWNYTRGDRCLWDASPDGAGHC
jgi:hypothetical protein